MADNTLDTHMSIVEKIDPDEEQHSASQSRQNTPDKEQFDAMMSKQTDNTKSTAVQSTERGSLMDVAREASPLSSATQVNRSNLIAQTQEAITKIEEIKKTLKSPNITIKNSAMELLQRKLDHIDESVKRALSRTGLESLSAEQAVSNKPHERVNPIERFLGYLTNGQSQLETLGSELRVMSTNGKNLTPVDMLAIQFKVSQIQQELELFTSLLNKALESVKTIMNIQV